MSKFVDVFFLLFLILNVNLYSRMVEGSKSFKNGSVHVLRLNMVYCQTVRLANYIGWLNIGMMNTF